MYVTAEKKGTHQKYLLVELWQLWKKWSLCCMGMNRIIWGVWRDNSWLVTIARASTLKKEIAGRLQLFKKKKTKFDRVNVCHRNVLMCVNCLCITLLLYREETYLQYQNYFLLCLLLTKRFLFVCFTVSAFPSLSSVLRLLFTT